MNYRVTQYTLHYNALSRLGLTDSDTLTVRQARIKARLQGQYITNDFADDGKTKKYRNKLLDDFIANAEVRGRIMRDGANYVGATELTGISDAINNVSDEELSERLENFDSRTDGSTEVNRERLRTRITSESVPNDFRDSGKSRKTSDDMLDS